MAKITANGTHEVARITVTTSGNNYRQLFVITSDGWVLTRYTDGISNGYWIYGRIKDESKRNMAFLQPMLERRGYTIQE